MTIEELGAEYGRSAALLRQRIVELEQARKETEDEDLRFRLDRRIRPLRVMLRETRQIARYLEHYYSGGGKRIEKGFL